MPLPDGVPTNSGPEAFYTWITENFGGAATAWATTTGVTYRSEGDRVWFGGELAVADAGVSTELGTLPVGFRPDATVDLPVWVINDGEGTPALIFARLRVTSAGVVSFQSAGTSLVGVVTLQSAYGVSFPLTTPA